VYPILLQFGGFTLRSYGFMAMLGFLTAWVLMRFNRRHAGLSDDQTSSLLLIAMAAGIGGARIFYVALNWEYYSRHWTRIIRIDQGGLVFYGGFLLAMASVIAYCKFRKLDVVRVLDVFAPGMAAAHAWGRVGCFLNGCCFGAPTTVPWAITFPAVNTMTHSGPGCSKETRYQYSYPYEYQLTPDRFRHPENGPLLQLPPDYYN